MTQGRDDYEEREADARAFAASMMTMVEGLDPDRAASAAMLAAVTLHARCPRKGPALSLRVEQAIARYTKKGGQ